MRFACVPLFVAAFLGVLLTMPRVSLASIDKIVFTTEVQTIQKNELSGPITIQTQDSSGVSFQTPETIDLEFTSTSETGEFLSSTGAATTKTMSKNTANRTFYYRDSSDGTFTITVRAIGRNLLGEWSASQVINVGERGSPVNNTEQAETNTANENTNPNPIPSSTSGPSVPSYGSPTSLLEVVAGSDRITAPGSPLIFQAFVKKNNAGGKLEFSWSFGDGGVGAGPIVNYTYKYPGEYVVVLNAKAGSSFASSRIKVRVAEAKLSIKSTDDYVEVINEGNSEINLFNWRAEHQGKTVIFQPDTIILPKSRVKFDKKIFSMQYSKHEDTMLLDSLERSVAVEYGTHKTNSPNITNEKLAELRQAALSIRDQVWDLRQESAAVTPPQIISAKIATLPATSSLTAVVYESEMEEIGFLATLTNFVKSIFSR